ncbi:MAG: hypothetical protein ACLRNQ_13530 [Flavonifractor plautii]
MRTVYLDNAATSYPKAPGVGAAMADYIERVGCNIGRGGYQRAYDAAGGAGGAGAALHPGERSRAAQCGVHLRGHPRAESVAQGTAAARRPGRDLPMEHNAVLRPLRQLERAGVEVEYLPCTERGSW